MKKRLDVLVVERALVSSRNEAQALIMSGAVVVNLSVVSKAGELVEETADIALKGETCPYVSRGGLKLEHALSTFDISVSGKTALDIGASTGGFTDCLLKRGATRVYAVDVGYGQFGWKLRRDERVTVFERTNIRYLDRVSIKDTIDIVVIDVSFISLKLVLPKAVEFLAPVGSDNQSGEIIALIKPQFEVGKGEVEKGGIIKTKEKRERVVSDISEFVQTLNLKLCGVCESPIKGHKGNIEYLLYAAVKK
ncbi:MAG: TlyA family RNA methyltransferase [Nitrospirae bacterium]|nr:TlyA family RNA methyltransferase [Nitrospirota bacterium]MBF0535661.1 TlyA family RNA methyltransferase [Nitrospirota bacterium]MBF0616967.1 TlyA family RNA methyltransferase [Nitrospirota bacterium]